MDKEFFYETFQINKQIHHEYTLRHKQIHGSKDVQHAKNYPIGILPIDDVQFNIARKFSLPPILDGIQ